jgi:hypothetical protein
MSLHGLAIPLELFMFYAINSETILSENSLSKQNEDQEDQNRDRQYVFDRIKHISSLDFHRN